MYIIQKIENIEVFKNKIFNANLDDYSDFDEKEILVFPFTCFEIVDIKEIKKDKIDYQIKLKYLGNYSDEIKKQLGDNFFDKIQISNFSEELIESGLVKVHNFFSNWIKKKELIVKLNKICFFLEGKEDVLCLDEKEIFIFNIHTFKEKQRIQIYNDRIVDVVKLKYNKICSFSTDGMVYVFQFFENNEKSRIIYDISLYDNYAIQAIFSKNYLLFLNKLNELVFYELKENNYNCLNEKIKENKILIMKKYLNNKVIYITEINGKKLINFIDLVKRQKEDDKIEIKEEKDEKLKVVDLIIFNGYIFIGYNHRIDVINYQNNNANILSFKFFDYEITNIIIFSSNKIILGFYDSEQNKSIIREHILRDEDLKNNLTKFDCIGQGRIENNNIENILKIYTSRILIKVKNNSCLIYERKNETSEILKETLLASDNSQIIIQKEEIKNNIDNIQKSDSENINDFSLEKKVSTESDQYPIISEEKKQINNFIQNNNNPHLNNYNAIYNTPNKENSKFKVDQKCFTVPNNPNSNKNLNNFGFSQTLNNNNINFPMISKETSLKIEAEHVKNSIPKSNKDLLKESINGKYIEGKYMKVNNNQMNA